MLPLIIYKSLLDNGKMKGNKKNAKHIYDEGENFLKIIFENYFFFSRIRGLFLMLPCYLYT